MAAIWIVGVLSAATRRSRFCMLRVFAFFGMVSQACAHMRVSYPFRAACVTQLRNLSETICLLVLAVLRACMFFPCALPEAKGNTRERTSASYRELKARTDKLGRCLQETQQQ